MEILENVVRKIEPFIHQETDDCVELRKQGYKLQNISNEAGVNISTVKDICSDRAYSELI